jgi:hypothetical protein
MFTKNKLKFWQNKLKELEDVDLPEAIRRINRVRVNDWYQNAEFEDSERQILIIKSRIIEIKLLIRKLEKERRR